MTAATDMPPDPHTPSGSRGPDAPTGPARATGRKRFTRARSLSSWRRLSVHVWDKPRDPTVYGNLEVDMRKPLEYLARLNAAGEGARVTVTHLVVKAIARALAETPDANAIIVGRRIYLRDSVDVYCQVATEGGRDLSGVKVEDADSKSLAEVAEELAERIARVRSGQDGSESTKRSLQKVPNALLGTLVKLIGALTYGLRLDLSRLGIPFDQFGSAMVSNVGGFGLGHGLAPLVPVSRVPIVLLANEVRPRPTVDDGQVVAAPMMTIGATFDHRLIDGYQASGMARRVIECVSDPESAFGPPTRSS